ncbi:hypothetical protein ASD64_07245 [Mesorhizobium sp. Root157]|uniref:hypothetical protein n=1 Tax=Mesorhizobium sp. Root157 TaxID=1736477 RepID=UPI0006FB375E|nr:hypothetical protein [Mesorhizobium sp. Root157]KQZ87226.1 hypothetical protein ASD64_07245 [Mesorhizobium sp. Root157]
MSGSEALQSAAQRVDVLDAAGHIIANPRRNAVGASSSTVLALAVATERFWAVCVEADLLLRALRLPQDTDENCAVADAAIAHQASEVARLLSAIRVETQALTEKEMKDGSSNA